jgi:hydroxyacylglutathione hydrolase
MNIETLIVGAFEVSCYVVWSNSKDAIIIDPGADADAIRHFLAEKKLRVAAYLLTHGHVDHISALADMFDSSPAPIALHAADLKWAFEEVNEMPPFYGVPRRPAEIARTPDDGMEYSDAGLTYKVISTPGHSPGSVCYYFESEDVLFTGDTLFAGSVGRTDLPGGNTRALSASLRKLADRFPDKTVIYPGHGPSSNLGSEKQTNYFMQTL